MATCCHKNFKGSSFDWKLKGPFLIVKIDWRATSHPPTPINSLNTSNQNFVIVILFRVVGNYVFEDDNTPPTVFSMSQGHIRYLWKWWSCTLGEGQLNWKYDVLIPLLRVKMIGDTCFPLRPMPCFPQMHPIKFRDSHLFKNSPKII